MRRCARITRSMQWVENELREIPTYEGLPKLATFLTEFESLVTKLQHLSTIDHVLKATPARWWGTHKQFITEWPQCKRLMEVIFGKEVLTMSHKYIGLLSPVQHINKCGTVFAEYPRQEWVHHFIHTLEMTPRVWHESMELRQGTQDWEEITK